MTFESLVGIGIVLGLTLSLIRTVLDWTTFRNHRRDTEWLRKYHQRMK